MIHCVYVCPYVRSCNFSCGTPATSARLGTSWTAMCCPMPGARKKRSSIKSSLREATRSTSLMTGGTHSSCTHPIMVRTQTHTYIHTNTHKHMQITTHVHTQHTGASKSELVKHCAGFVMKYGVLYIAQVCMGAGAEGCVCACVFVWRCGVYVYVVSYYCIRSISHTHSLLSFSLLSL